MVSRLLCNVMTLRNISGSNKLQTTSRKTYSCPFCMIDRITHSSDSDFKLVIVDISPHRHRVFQDLVLLSP